MQFQGNFTIGLKENFRYNLFITKRRTIVTSCVVFAIILLLNAFLRYAYGSVASFRDGLLYSLPMAVIGAVAIFLFSILFMYLRLRSMYKKHVLSPFQQKIMIDHAGVHGTTDKGNIDLPWKNVGVVRENRTDFVIFVTESHAYVLPKEQMQNPTGDSDILRNILRQRMDSSRLHLKG